MSDQSEAYAKLSEAVEALEDLGLYIEDANVEEVHRQSQNPLYAMFGKEPEEVQVIQILATVDDDAPTQELPDDDRDDGVPISFSEREDQA